MAKTNMIARDTKRAVLIKREQPKRDVLKAIISNPDSSYEEKMNAVYKLADMPRDGSYIRYRNRCRCCGRSRGVYSKFRMCRLCIRTLFNLGAIPGLVKSSW